VTEERAEPLVFAPEKGNVGGRCIFTRDAGFDFFTPVLFFACFFIFLPSYSCSQTKLSLGKFVRPRVVTGGEFRWWVRAFPLLSVVFFYLIRSSLPSDGRIPPGLSLGASIPLRYLSSPAQRRATACSHGTGHVFVTQAFSVCPFFSCLSARLQFGPRGATRTLTWCPSCSQASGVTLVVHYFSVRLPSRWGLSEISSPSFRFVSAQFLSLLKGPVLFLWILVVPCSAWSGILFSERSSPFTCHLGGGGSYLPAAWRGTSFFSSSLRSLSWSFLLCSKPYRYRFTDYNVFPNPVGSSVLTSIPHFPQLFPFCRSKSAKDTHRAIRCATLSYAIFFSFMVLRSTRFCWHSNGLSSARIWFAYFLLIIPFFRAFFFIILTGPLVDKSFSSQCVNLDPLCFEDP